MLGANNAYYHTLVTMSVDGLGLGLGFGLAPYITKELVKEVNEASGGFIEMVEEI